MSYLAIVQGINACEELSISVNKFGKFKKQVSTLESRKSRPRSLESSSGCFHGSVDILLGSALKGDDGFIEPNPSY